MCFIPTSDTFLLNYSIVYHIFVFAKDYFALYIITLCLHFIVIRQFNWLKSLHVT